MKSHKTALFILLGIIVVMVLCFGLVRYNLVEKKEYIAKFEVGELPGFDLNSTALTFGRIPPKSSSTRSILLKNDFDKRVFVSLSSTGLSNYLSISENDFFLGPGENKTVSFFINVPASTGYGTYVGRVEIVMHRWRF